MDVRQLRYFEAVARHRHFTRAADELHVAQSALSHQIRGLEAELGAQLLQRTTRAVALTDAGELVLGRARAVLSEMSALQGEIDEMRGLMRGHLTVGAHLFGGELDIPAILSKFTRTYPGIEITLREGSARQMVRMLDEGSLDVTFALESVVPSDIERLELSSEELAAAMSPRHALAGRTPLKIARLQGHPLIAFHRGSSTRDVVDGAFAEAGVSPRIALESNDFALVRSLVAGGVGVALLPRSFLERPGPRISFRSLSPALRMTVALWWRRGRRLSPAAQAFVEFTAAQRARRAGTL
jgi:DNA-binding transcriptional LysR family regulator